MVETSRAYQSILFISLYCSYALYIFNRRSFSNVIPYVVEDGLEEKSVGAILSTLALAYSVGKFLSEILVDSYSPRLLHCIGIFSCGVTNILFTYVSSQSAYTVLWFLNGIFQGLGWPSCGKLLQRWYPSHLFGTLWSVLSTSMNLAASLGPLLSTLVVEQYGAWQWSMRLIGLSSIVYTAFLLAIIKDSPQIETFEKGKSEDVLPPDETDSFKIKAIRVIKSPYSYIISFIFFVSIMTKVVFSDWGPLYLMKEKNATGIDTGIFNGFLEMGGLIGSIIVGMLTDFMVRTSKPYKYGHPRHYILIPITFILAISIHVFSDRITDVNTNRYLFNILGFVIGFCIYGLINIAGVLSIQQASPNLTGASHAITALWGNIGLSCGGLPFSYLATKYSWNFAYFLTQCLVLILGISLVACQLGMVCKIGFKPTKKSE